VINGKTAESPVVSLSETKAVFVDKISRLPEITSVRPVSILPENASVRLIPELTSINAVGRIVVLLSIFDASTRRVSRISSDLENTTDRDKTNEFDGDDDCTKF
jgi:hypothetical protein